MSHPPVFENACLPFDLDGHFRGRLIRLGPVMDAILKRHAYPPIVARMLAETMLLCAALAGALKYDGVFTLQAKGDGAVSSVVADITTAGALRAYAMYDAERVAVEDPGTDATALLLGHGYIAFTVDQGKHTERYQGIVELSGRTMADVTANYFRQSEQIATGLVVAAEQREGDWRGAAIMLQKMPQEDQNETGGNPELDEDHIRRAMILLGTATSKELLDEGLPGPKLLHRLYHDDGLNVYPATDIKDECRCNRGRVERVLRSLSREEIDELAVNEQIVVTCEFCGRTFTFTPEALHNLDKVLTLDVPDNTQEDNNRESILLRPDSKGDHNED